MLLGLQTLAADDGDDGTQIEIGAEHVAEAVARLQALRPAQLQLLAKAGDYQVAS
jgi:hypothetical protein